MKLKQYAADTQKKFVTAVTYIYECHSKYKRVDSLTVEDFESFLNYLAFEKFV